MSTFSPDRPDGLVKTGQVLARKYRVEGVIGSGAMGEVVAAMHLQLKERVAIKLLRPEALLVPHASARFIREARAAVKIKSEHVGRVLDVGVLDDGTPMMVMEYLKGTDLHALLDEQGPLPIPLAVDYVLQACEAIAEAHALGIVHRDLKPANLFLARRADGSPCVKVLDFGISKVTLAEPSASEAAMARTTATMGSPAYMSPEQLHSTADVDARTDIWALGVTLYQLLTNAYPFIGATLVQLYTKIREQPVPSVRAARAAVPAALDAAIGRCLQRDLDKRYATVAELAEALAPFGSLSAKISADRIARIVPGARAACV